MMKLMYNKNTLYKELLENKEINISFELFYAHLEYLYFNSLISYPNTIAEKLSTFNFFNFISNEKYETLKQKQPNLFDFEMKNNHSPLYILKLDKINIEEGNKEKADEIEAAAGQELGKENWEKKKF